MSVNIDAGILRFRIDVPQLNTAVSGAMKAAQNQVKQANNAIVSDTTRAIAQLRAQMAQGILGTSQIADARKNITAALESQISPLAKANELTKSQLSNLKAMTLELERQKSAQASKGGVGITAGTASALNQLSFQTTQGIERMADAIINRALGPTAGAFARTLRDVSYYSGVGAASRGTGAGSAVAGGAGAETTEGQQASGGLLSNLTKISPLLTTTNLAIGGMVAGLGALAVASVGVTRSLVDQNEQIKNTSVQTGLSTREVQIYGEAAKELGLNQDAITSSLARLQAQLGKYILTGKDAGEGTAQFVQVAKSLGVTLEDTQGKLRPIGSIIADLQAAFRNVPEQNRTAEFLDAIGIRAKELAPLILRTDVNLGQLFNNIGAQSGIIETGLSSQLDTAKQKLDELSRSMGAVGLMFKQGFVDIFTAGMPSILASIDAANAKFQDQQKNRQALLASRNAGPVKPGEVAIIDPVKQAQAVQQLQNQLDIMRAGGQIQAQIVKLQQQENELIKDGTEADLKKAIGIEQQIQKLQRVLDLQKEINNPAHYTYGYGSNTQYGPRQLGTIVGVPTPNINQQNLIPPALTQGLQGIAGENPLLSLFGTQKSAQEYLDEAAQVTGELYDITKDETQKINAEYQQRYKDFQEALSKYPAFAQTINQAIIDAQKVRDQRIKDQQDQAVREMAATAKQESDELFNAIVNGGKDRGKEIAQVFRNIALEPVRTIFENLTKGIFESINNTLGIGKGQSGSAAGASGGGPFSGVAGGIFGAIFHGFGGSKGSKTPPILGGTTPAGTIPQVQVPEMYVTAATVYLTAGTLLSGSGTSTGAPAGANGFAGRGLFGLGNLGSPINYGVTPGTNTGVNIGGRSSSTTLGGLFGSSNAASIASSLGTLVAGGGMIYGATQAGGVGGALSGGLGGALAGKGIGSLASAINNTAWSGSGAFSTLLSGISSIAPFLSIAGSIGGLLAGAFGGGATARQNAYNKNIQNAALAQRITLPPSETFSFAQGGSMGQTFGQTFSSNGSQFSAVALPSNTPFWQQGILGTPKYANQLSWLNSSIGHPQTGLPFFGGGSDIFAGTPTPGQIGVNTGVSMTGAAPTVNVTVAGYVDETTFKSKVLPDLTAAISKAGFSTSSGNAQAARRAVLNQP